MAIPVIAGIPWLAGVVGGLIAGAFEFFTKYLTKRIAVVAAVVATIIGLTTAMFAGINAIAAGIAISAPPEFGLAASLVVPSNAAGCFSAYLSAHILHYAYRWNVKIVQMKLF